MKAVYALLLGGAAVLVAGSSPGRAEVATDAEWRLGDITVDQAWSRRVPGEQTAAVYFRIRNAGRAMETITKIASPAATSASFHATDNAKGIVSMSTIRDGLQVPPGASVSLRPGTKHIMLEGIEPTLRAGNVVPLWLKLEKTGWIAIAVPLLPLEESDPISGEHN
jgi:copper(I)-binding protein